MTVLTAVPELTGPSSTSATGMDGMDFHAVQRRLATLVPDGAELHSPDAGGTLEVLARPMLEPPRLMAADLVEDRTLRARRVPGEPAAAFAAFLDGTQASRPVRYVDGVPIVHGAAAAVIRAREDRRLRTWERPRVDQRLYAPLALLPDPLRRALWQAGVAEPVDTLADRDDGAADHAHPFALQDAAVHAVQDTRERLERGLATQWVRSGGDGVLLVDGSIAGGDPASASRRLVGVIKSHRTLYAAGDALRVVLRLEAGERSSVFRITSPKRQPVASWYLRLRDPAGRDPLWGLLRVEVADMDSARDATRRADEVSRWVLAEALPLSLPDSRWDTMVYGIRDCEEFLRALL